jgi:hypothetical protein
MTTTGENAEGAREQKRPPKTDSGPDEPQAGEMSARRQAPSSVPYAFALRLDRVVHRKVKQDERYRGEHDVAKRGIQTVPRPRPPHFKPLAADVDESTEEQHYDHQQPES